MDVTKSTKDTSVDGLDSTWLSFGGDKKSKKKTTASGFDFGNIGSLDETKEEPEDPIEVKGVTDNWATGFASSGKQDKKKKKGAFDDFLEEPDPNQIGAAVVEPVAAAGDTWGGWGDASNKKGQKKGKKGEIEDVSPVPPSPPPPPVVPVDAVGEWASFGLKKDKKKSKKGNEEPVVVVPETEHEADLGLGAFTSRKEKKKGKKGAVEEENPKELDVVVVPDQEPEAELGGWGSFGTKKDKKKGKKFLEEEKAEEPAVKAVPDPEPDIDQILGSFGAKKEKKKGKKGMEEVKLEEADVVQIQDPEPEADIGWGSVSTKKDKKKGKKGTEEVKDPEPPIVEVPDHEREADTSWVFGLKKDKKKGKKIIEEEIPEEPTVEAIPEAETLEGWGSYGKKDKKKTKKGAYEEPDKLADQTMNAELGAEIEPVVDSGWGAFAAKKEKKKGKKEDPEDPWPTEDKDAAESEQVVEDMFSSFTSTSKKDKKGKKGGLSEVKEDPISTFDFTAGEATNIAADTDNWMDFGSDKKKDKKGKKGSATDTKIAEVLPPPPPPVPTVPAVCTFDTWGTSKKDKDKKSKKGKATEPEPAIVTVPDPVEDSKADPMEDDWGTRGLSSKDKRKKEKEREEAKKREREEEEREEKERKEDEEREREKEKEKDKSKPKGGKKGKTSGVVEPPKSKDLMSDSMFGATPAVEDDTWGSWGASKKDKMKGGKNDIAPELPPPAPTPPAQGLTPEPTIDDIGEDGWGEVAPAKPKNKKDAKKPTKEDSKAVKKGIKDKDEEIFIESPKDGKKKEPPKADTAAKATKSFWGSIGATSTSKSKVAKETDMNKDMEGGPGINELDLSTDSDEIIEIVEEPVKKGLTSKTESKLSKSAGRDGDKASKDSDKASKLSDKKKKDATADIIVDEATVSSKGSKSKGLDAKDKSDDKKDDASGFWAGSKKTSGKKADEPKKEITKQDSPNQKSSLKGISNDPEGTSKADEPSQPPPFKSSKTTMFTSKTTGKLSVAQKVKALEEERKKTLEPAAPPPVAEWEPLSKADSPPQKSSSASKTKTTPASKTSASKKKDLSPSPVEDKKISRDSVPGSFPGEGADDDLIDMITSPTETKSKKKDLKSKNKPKPDLMDLGFPIVEASPTPPEEPMAAKPAKKERARVVRDEGASSWGFWGAASKKDVKKERRSKDEVDVTSPAAKERTPPPGLSRSKSTKTAKDKEKETEKSKSSGSDKADKDKKAESRPLKSRQSSFGGLFGGPPPTRTTSKPVRRASIAAARSAPRRRSMDVDAIGLPSPPPDAPEMTPKAAKLMGMGSGKLGRKESTRGKQKASGKGVGLLEEIILESADCIHTAVPDPYAIDDDDMVMVNSLKDPVINVPAPKKTPKKEKPSKSKSKAEPDLADDIVMVESGPSQDGPEPLAFDEKPRGLQRSMTSAKKPDHKIMGLFGGFGRKPRRVSDSYERPRTKIAPENEGNLRRKRTITGSGDAAKRLRRDDRKIHRSDKDILDADGFVTDAAGDGGAGREAEDVEARKEERRAKRAAREQAAKDAEDAKLRTEKERRAKRREAERAEDEKRKAKARDARDRRARKEEEAEAILQEEKRARRAAREERLTKEDTVARDLEGPSTERRSKHRDRDLPEGETSRPRKSDRRRSHMDKPFSPTLADDPDHRERNSRPKTNRRKSTAPVEDYFDPRNGAKGVSNEEPGSGYPHKNANDHTSSWVKSQLSDPAPPPPIEPTVIEPPPVLGGADKYDDAFVADEDERRAMHRKSRRHSKYVGGEDGGGERRRRRDEVRSEESEEGRVYPRKKPDFVLGAGVKTSGAGVPGGKRGSWFKRVGLPL